MSLSYTYRIDGLDRITDVSPAWLLFAKKNDAAELDESRVIGREIWEFIVGDEVRRVYKEIFRSLRESNKELIVPFRCDSPGIMRHMELHMRSAPANAIEFTGKLDTSLRRRPVSLFDVHASRSEDSIPICSFCRRLKITREWVPAAAAVTRKRWFGNRPVPKLNESLCRDCMGSLYANLQIK